MRDRGGDRRWVQRLIAEEKPAAAILLLAGAAGLVAANVLGAATTRAVLHPTFAGRQLDLPWFAADGLLVVFFFVAGLELRHEFSRGVLSTPRAASIPVLAALCGMVVPAGIFIALAPEELHSAWGVPMATDLPLALALVAVFGRGLPLTLRAFILSLAIVDDALSIVVIAIVFGTQVSLPWCAVTLTLVVTYARLQRHSNAAGFGIALAAWGAMLHTGIHATVLGVALGLLTSADTDAIRNRWQPFAGLVAVPLFAATALAIPLSVGDVNPRLVAATTLARIVGKPAGILAGALVAQHWFGRGQFLAWREYLTAGCVASVGFSVSMLFAQLGVDSSHLRSTTWAILTALIVSTIMGALALFRLRRSGLTE